MSSRNMFQTNNTNGEMKMNTSNNNEQVQQDERTVYTDAMLPELNQADIENAESVYCKSWVLGKLKYGRTGSFGWHEDMCLGLQITGEDSMRCFAAGSIDLSLRSLAMLKHTCESIGIVFETEGYTVLIQPDSEGPAEVVETTESVGMEVA